MNLLDYIACHECDLLNQRGSLNPGETAKCHRCGATLYREKIDMINRSLALNLAALILYLITISLPFLAIEAGGQISEINLIETVSALYSQGMMGLSFLICFVLLAVPVMRITGMLLILVPLKFRLVPAYSKVTYYIVEWMAPWNMMDVFLIGILVTFVKLGSMAKIILGTSFWAFIALVIVIIATNVSVDSNRFWDVLES